MLKRVRISNLSGEEVDATEGATVFIEYAEKGKRRLRADLTEKEAEDLAETLKAQAVRERRKYGKVAA